jgi:hypothetical protein
VRRAALAASAAACQAVLMAFFAPALVVCLASGWPRRGTSRRDIYLRLSVWCAITFPPVIGLWAWLLAWLLHMPPPGPLGQVSAIVIGIAFLAQSLLLLYPVVLAGAFGGAAVDASPAARPLVFFLSEFTVNAMAFIFYSLPLAVIVAVIGLLT